MVAALAEDRLLHLRSAVSAPAEDRLLHLRSAVSLLHSGSAVSAPAVDRLLPRVHSAGGGHLRCSRLWFRLSGRGLSTGLNDNSIILNEI